MDSGNLPLDEALQFQHHSFQKGTNPFSSPTRPVGTAIEWLASNGRFIARVTGTTQIAIRDALHGDNEDSHTIATTAGIVRLAFRQSLLAVAQNDGSIECYDVLSSSQSQLRWRLANVHSFVSNQVDTPLSFSRDWGASAAGPLASFELNDAHQLLLVDASARQQALIYNAAESPPNAPVKIDGATSAAWVSSDVLAVGKGSGEIDFYKFMGNKTELLSTLSSPAEDASCITYLACHNATTIVAGYSNVLANEDDDDDDDEEDDDAEHLVVMYLASLSGATLSSEWSDMGDVVPFFSVPKHGRHTFYTQFIDNILVVAANVGSEIALVDLTDATLLELTEGSGATTPTTDDDDYTFCVGLATVGQWLYISATDGSLTCLKLQHTGNDHYFKAPSTQVSMELVPILESIPPPSTTAAQSFGSLATSPTVAQMTTPAFHQTSTLGENKFGQASASTAAPAFGQTSGLGPAVGPTAGQATGFGGFGSAPASNPFTFGSLDQKTGFTFGATSNALGPKPSEPEKKVALTSTFGSGTTIPSFGTPFGASFDRPTFGALASETKDAPGFLNASDKGTSSIPNPFGAFGSPKKSTTPTGILAKPLFGSSPAPAPTPVTNPFGAFIATSATLSTSGTMAKPLFGPTSGPATKPEPPTTPSTSDEPDFAAILTKVYEKDHPQKLKDIPKLLKKYKGKENEMFEKISKTYNIPNPLSSPVREPVPEKIARKSDEPDYVAILTKVYEKNYPEKLKDIPKLLKKYKGKEDEMFAKIAATYGIPDPLISSRAIQVPTMNKSEPSLSQVTQEERDDIPGAKTAAETFDSLDQEKSGRLPIDRFEALLEELGEGFHGEEFDAQVALVDPDGTNQIERHAFIAWYCGLLEAEGENDDELDDDELLERDEERQRVLAIFKIFSEDEGNTIAIDVFSKFMKKIGTTYAEEVHGKAAKKIERPPGRIPWSAFEAWYIPWLFEGDDESDDESDEEAETREKSMPEATVTTKGWGNIFGKPKGWKCSVCMIQNSEDKKKCASCETIRPGCEAEVANEATKGAVLSGNPAFSFGVPTSATTAPKSSAFSFGVSASSPQVSSGFSFGTSSVSSTAAVAAPALSSSGFSFGVAKDDKKAIQSGFGFGITQEVKKESISCVGSGVAKENAEDAVKSASTPVLSTSGYPPISLKAPVNPLGTSSSAPATKDSSGVPDYDALLTKVYQEHEPAKLKDVPALLRKFKGKETVMFDKVSTKYGIVNPLDDSVTVTKTSSISYPPISKTAPANPFGKDSSLGPVPSASTQFAFAKSSSQTEKKPLHSVSTMSINSSPPPSSMKGLTATGTSIPSDGTMSEKCAFVPSPFGTKPQFGAPSVPQSKPSLSQVTQEERDDIPGAKTAAETFDSLDQEKSGRLPIDRFEALLEELGEGFHGEEFDAQVALVDPDGTNQIERHAFIAWYCGLLEAEGENDDELDDDELLERDEERQRVLAIFKIFSEDEGNTIAIDVFSKFMKKIGTTYAEEVHGKAAKKIERPPGRIPWSAFEAWYIPWLFEGDDESDDESDEEAETREKSMPEATVTTKGWGNIFGKPKGWKCSVCMIQNSEDKKKCASCETIRPGCEAEVANEATKGAVLSGNPAFSFGVPTSATTAPKSSAFSFGVSASSPQVSSGFSFGTSSVSSTAAVAAPALASSGFSFGVAKDDKKAIQSGFGFGITQEVKKESISCVGSGVAKENAEDAMKSASTPVLSTSGYPPISLKAPVNPLGTSSSAPATKDSSGVPDYDALLTKVYQEHEPAKLKDVPALLRKFKGKETVMFDKVSTKYGIVNPLDDSVTVTKTSSISHPPISKTAPANPFGKDSDSSLHVNLQKPAALSGYPPMSSSAPKNPFGKSPAPAPAPKAALPAAASGYPPISSSAPTNPFGKSPAPAPAPKAALPAAASGYPPISSSAPTNPFGKSPAPAPAPKAALPAAASGYPPISSSAPTNPFGKSPAPAPALKAALPAAASGYPPISSSAPTNPFGKSPAPAPAPKAALPAAASGYPPISSSAPTNPFGKSPAPAPAPKAALPAASGYPPISSSAPTNRFGKIQAPATTLPGFPSSSSLVSSVAPFGAPQPSSAPTLSTKSSMPSISSGLPPLSSSVKTNLFEKIKTPENPQPHYSSTVSSGPTHQVGNIDFKAASDPTVSKIVEQTSNSVLQLPAKAPTDSTISVTKPTEMSSRPVSKFEAQFVEAMTTFQESILSLTKSSPLVLDALQKDVKVVVENREKMWNVALDLKSEVAAHKQRSVFLVSRKPDLERQLGEANRLIGMYKKSQSGQNGTLPSQTLDASSEQMRRQLAAEAIMIPRLVDILEGEVNLMRAIQGEELSYIRRDLGGKDALFKAVENVNDLSNVVNSASSRPFAKVIDMSSKIPRSWSSSAWKSPEPKGRNSKSRISPHPGVEAMVNPPGPSLKYAVEEQSSGAQKWKHIERQFKIKATESPKQTKINLPPAVLTFKGDKAAGTQPRTGQSSLLLSPQHIETRTERCATIAPELFSVSTSSLSTRSEWDTGFTTDQVKVRNLSFNLPTHLSEVNASDAARESLAQYGTTPEKLARVTQAKQRAEAAWKTPPNDVILKEPSTPNRGPTSLSGGLPPIPNKTSTPSSQKFAPVQTVNEQSSPFSKNPSSDTAAKTRNVHSDSSGYPPFSKVAPKPFSSTTQSSETLSKNQTKPDKVESSAFGGMQSLGASLFPSVAQESGRSPFGNPSSIAPSKASATSGPDYHAILTTFYETHNPEKVKDVAKHLERYKGRESDMFGKLAARYKAPNPLDAVSSTPSVKTSTPLNDSITTSVAALSSSSSASVFGAVSGNTTAGPKLSTTPFSSKASPLESNLSAPAPGLSPFESGAQGIGPFGGGAPAAAPTPFGSSSSTFAVSMMNSSQAPPPTGFTSTMSTDTPFGRSSNTPAASPFSTGAPTPFGSAAPSSPAGFGGKSNRDLLVAFYQQYNPSKMSDVDMVLQKYKGQEEKLFRNLAHKYNVDPVWFGLGPAPSPAPNMGGFGGGFGQASVLGSGSVFGGGNPAPAPAFGSPSGLGSNITFSGGFGSIPAPLSGGFGASASGGFGGSTPAPAFGNPSPFGGSTSGGGFGSLAQQGGGGFGASSSGGFGGPSPFGAPPSGVFGGGGNDFGGSPFGAPRR